MPDGYAKPCRDRQLKGKVTFRRSTSQQNLNFLKRAEGQIQNPPLNLQPLTSNLNYFTSTIFRVSTLLPACSL